MELVLAEVDARLAGGFDDDTVTSAGWFVQWMLGGAACRVRVGTVVTRIGDASVPTWVAGGVQCPEGDPPGAGCAGDACAWSVPFEVQPGTPGVLRWTVPRALLPHAAAGDVLDNVLATSSRSRDLSLIHI